MLQFAAVIRNQPNKYISCAKLLSQSAARREDLFEVAGFETNFEPGWEDAAGDVWKKITQSGRYDCYVDVTKEVAFEQVAMPRTSGTPSEHLKNDELKDHVSAGRCDKVETNFQESCEEGEPSETDTVSAAQCDRETDAVGGHDESFIVLNSGIAKFAKLVELLKSVPASKKILVVVDQKCTDVVLVIAVLCLSGVASERIGRSSTLVQVAASDDLHGLRTRVDIIINVDMVPSMTELAERAKLLKEDGTMKTFCSSRTDEGRARVLTSEIFRCGLVLPFELEAYLL